MPRGKASTAAKSDRKDSAQEPPRSRAHDEWAPPDYEMGATLSQVLHRPSRGGPSTRRAESKPSPLPAAQTAKPQILPASPQPSEPVRLSDGDSDSKREQEAAVDVAKQIAAVSAMFEDDDDESDNVSGGVGGGTRSDGASTKEVDGGLQACVKSESISPSQMMDFMDEESARNYQRILANSKRERSERRQAFRASGSRHNNESPPKTAPHKPQPPPLLARELSASADELPDDPLAEITTPPRYATSSKRKRHTSLRICDSEASDDNEVLDERKILHQRLRTKPAQSSATPSRFEQARLNMERETYDSDTDHEDQYSIGAYDSGNGAGAAIDTLDTDSEPERVASNAVMVIRDSSDDDDDFISDPEDRPPLPRPRVAGRSRASKEDMSSFISKFEPRRRKQMQGKLDQKSGNSTTAGSRQHRPPLSPPRGTLRAVKGYGQDLDDDIADFIVEDGDDDDEAGSSGIAATAATRAANRDTSASSYDSDNSARPKFSREGPRGVMALMPDEFSMFDLPTSFKAYVQYLVHWICNDHRKPVVNDTNARYFFQAYIAVARVIDSVEQSVVASSAWVEPFRTSLHAYPDYAAAPIPGIPGCDACHFHSNRTATFCVTLSGTPYKRAILAPPKPGELSPIRDSAVESDGAAEDGESGGLSEVVTIGDDSDDFDDTEGLDSSRSGSGGQLHVDYNLGKVCKMRSEICHGLHHYFYHLAHTVEIRLGTLDYESKSPAMAGGNLEDVVPDDLVEMLDAKGEIDDLFQQFKDFISRAKSGFTS